MAQQQQRYKVLEKIASGGMAEVFRAESAGLEGFKKTVAIKRVLPHLSEKKQFMGMFLDEARLSARLSHSNCVQVFDIGVGDNTYFIVMEYVDGSDLKGLVDYVKRIGRPFPIEVALLIAVKICEGLSYAHELFEPTTGQNLQIVHRDMSPPNVLLTRYGEVKIVDFGLAKANSQLERSEPGIIKGKFSYLSPEAAQGQSVDARTDIFAVGIILWELLAGRRLFLGETDLETVRQVQAARVPPIRQFNPAVSPELERVMARGLAADPAQRYQRARDFGRDLTQVMFSLGRAVSSFDLAQLIEPIWADRQQKKQREKVDRRSLIGTLIDEALFEFTSLQSGDRASSPSDGGSAPLSIGSFENVQDWTRDLGDLMDDHRSGASSDHQFEVGNLAALEEQESRRRGPGAISSSPPAPTPATAPITQRPPADAPLQPAAKSASKGGVIALIVVLVLAVGFLGAYFTGVLPKNLLR